MVTRHGPVTGSPVTAPGSDWHTLMGDFAAEVRRLMKTRHMSLRETARAAGYSDHTLVSKVLNGHKPVTPYMAACLDEALSADGAIIAAAEAAASQAEAVRLPLRELADHAAELGAWAESGTAGPGTIATLDDEIARVTREYGSSQPGPLILRASDACRRTAWLLRQHQRLRHARDLYVVAARCCAFLAVALGDLGRQAEAAAYARTALTLAEESADPGAVALALSALSKIAFWDGLRQQSASLAGRGLAVAREDDPLRVLLACQQADVSPVPVAREVLAQAAAAREETAGNGRSDGGLFDCGTVRLAGYAATLALREGSLAGVLAAAAAAEGAVRDGEDVPYGSLSQAGALASGAPYKGSPGAREIAEQIAGYLGHEPGVMPHPLAIAAGSVR